MRLSARSVTILILALLPLLTASPALPQARVSGGATMNVGPAAQVTMSVLPTTAVVSTTSTQVFTFTINNDNAGKGATLVLTGSGCSGATCGTLSSIIAHNGSPITYTAPSTLPSPPSVTLTATSVQDP